MNFSFYGTENHLSVAQVVHFSVEINRTFTWKCSNLTWLPRHDCRSPGSLSVVPSVIELGLLTSVLQHSKCCGHCLCSLTVQSLVGTHSTFHSHCISLSLSCHRGQYTDLGCVLVSRCPWQHACTVRVRIY